MPHSSLLNVWIVLKPLLKVIVTTLLALLLIIAFILGVSFLLLTLPYKLFVYLLAKSFDSSLDSFVTGLSCLFAVDKIHHPRASLVNFCVLAGEIPLDKFRRLCLERVLDLRDKNNTNKFIYKKLRQSWTHFGGYSFWRWDGKFDVQNHVRIYDYQEPHLKLPTHSNENDLRRLMGGLASAPWPENRSPWEWLLIYNYEPHPGGKPQMVFVIRRHHILGDGYSSLELIRHLFQAELPLAMPSMREPPTWLKALAPIVLPFKVPYDFAANLIESIDLGNCWQEVTELTDYHTSLTGPVGVEGIKEIKRCYGVSFMAVVFAAVCGGIKRLMEDAGQKVPSSMGVVIPVPKPNHPGGMCNHMFLVFTRWPIKIASRVERLRRIQGNISELQTSAAPVGLDIVLQTCSYMPAFFINMIASFMSCTVVSSIFPGSLSPVFFEGFEVIDHFSGGGTLRSPIGASVVIVGAYGRQRVVVNVNKNISPQPELFAKLGQYIEDELDELLQGAQI